MHPTDNFRDPLQPVPKEALAGHILFQDSQQFSAKLLYTFFLDGITSQGDEFLGVARHMTLRLRLLM